jgi:hypothetical protein
MITRLKGKLSFRMGAPPVPGKAVTTGKSVAVSVFTAVFTAVVVLVGVPVAEMVPVTVMVGVVVVVVVVVIVGVVVVVVVGVAVGCTRQLEPVMVLLSNVTAPVCAMARPFKFAPVCRLIDVDARILPINEVFTPRVAELTTRHHTLHGSPPTTLALPEVIRVAADLKIHTPDPLSVSVPVNVKASAQ